MNFDADLLRVLIVTFAEAIAATPADAPSVRSSNRTRRQVLMEGIEGAADVLGTLG